ncbi:MAG: squalene/phytoene synthase family protein [Pseudomonadota bacterium]
MNSEHNDLTSLNYCITKAIPDGSNLYYACLFEKQENKIIIITLHAFLHELNDIIIECSDPGVARIKLKWWQEEIERLFDNQPRHPVTRQMKISIKLNQELKLALGYIICAFEQLIFLEQTDHLDSILSLFESVEGEIWVQCSQQLKVDDVKSIKIVREMGALNLFFTGLQQPYSYINDMRCLIPASYIEKSDLLNMRNQASKRAEQKKIFSPLINDIQNRLDKTYTKFKTEYDIEYKYPLIMNQLIFKTCNEILYDGCNLLNKNVSMTPLRKLWLAWRIYNFA